jgi:hypothetical protein
VFLQAKLRSRRSGLVYSCQCAVEMQSRLRRDAVRLGVRRAAWSPTVVLQSGWVLLLLPLLLPLLLRLLLRVRTERRGTGGMDPAALHGRGLVTF